MDATETTLPFVTGYHVLERSYVQVQKSTYPLAVALMSIVVAFAQPLAMQWSILPLMLFSKFPRSWYR